MRKRHLLCRLLLIFGVAACLASHVVHCYAGDLIVVANKNISENSLTEGNIKQIYLGEKTEWTDNSKIIFVVLDNDRDADTFIRKYVGRSYKQFMNYWRQQLFTGNGQLPRVFKTSKELEEYIANTHGAVGYIPSEDLTADLKTLEVK